MSIFNKNENHYGKTVKKIYLSGGSASLYGIDSIMKEVLSDEIIIWNPFDKIKFSEDISVENIVKISIFFNLALSFCPRV